MCFDFVGILLDWIYMRLDNAIIAGVFGLFFGSFLNVVDLRFGHWKSIALSRSACPKCHHVLAWYDLVPLFSFIFLRGKCRYCHHSISWQYPLIELSSGVIVFSLWWSINPGDWLGIIKAVLAILLGEVMLLMSLQDWKEMLVHDVLFASALIIGLLIWLVNGWSLITVLLSLAVTALPLAVLALISKERWMGWGDVLIALAVGLQLVYPLGFIWFYLAFFTGAGIGVILILLGLKRGKDPVPFIPILLLSYLITSVWGQAILNRYLYISGFR